MVSIIMPCYNSQKYISTSIKSVLSQSMTEWELIIINDASTDKTKEIIESFANLDSRIKVFHLKKNSSAAVARNIGITNARYKNIAFLDSDDLWLPQKLERQLSLMQKYDLPFSYSSYYVINNESKVLGIRKAQKTMTYNKLLHHGNDIGCLTVIYNKELFAGSLFNEKIRIHEDYKMWLDMFQNITSAEGIEEPLALYRVHPGSKNLNKFRSLKWNWMLWRDYQKLGFFTSLFISARWVINKTIQKYSVLFLSNSHNNSVIYPSADQKSVY